MKLCSNFENWGPCSQKIIEKILSLWINLLGWMVRVSRLWRSLIIILTLTRIRSTVWLSKVSNIDLTYTHVELASILSSKALLPVYWIADNLQLQRFNDIHLICKSNLILGIEHIFTFEYEFRSSLFFEWSVKELMVSF